MEMQSKTGRRGLQAPTMEGAAEEAPTPCCFPFSRSLSARPRPAGCHRRSPAPREPHRPKMAAPRLPPLPPAAGSDAAAAWSSANQRGRSEGRLLLLGATRPVGSQGEVPWGLTGLVSCSARGVPMVQSAWASLTLPGPPPQWASCARLVGWHLQSTSELAGLPYIHMEILLLAKVEFAFPGPRSKGWSY